MMTCASSELEARDLDRERHELQIELQRTSEENSSLKAKYHGLGDEYDGLYRDNTRAWDHIDKLQLNQEETQARIEALVVERDRIQRDCHESQRTRQATEADAEAARHQLAIFKSSISSATKISNQITDEGIRSKVDQIFYGVQEFALTMTRSAPLDVSRLSGSARNWAANHVLDAERLPSSYHANIVIGLMARTLVRFFAPDLYFGISANPAIRSATSLALAFKGASAAIAEMKAWLEPTRKLLETTDKVVLEKSMQSLVDRAVLHALKALSLALPAKPPAYAETRLRKTFASAFELFRMLHRSKASFQVEFSPAVLPDGASQFRAEQMQALNSVDEDSVLEGRTIQVSVFPGVFKFGDEMGNNQDEMTVICKARVVPQEKPRPLHCSK